MFLSDFRVKKMLVESKEATTIIPHKKEDMKYIESYRPISLFFHI